MPEVKIELPEIEGYEYTGEFRIPERGEYYLTDQINVGKCTTPCFKALILKKKRWRAGKRDVYYFIDSDIGVNKDCEEFSPIDDERYNSGNYFKTRTQAEEMRDKILKLLKER